VDWESNNLGTIEWQPEGDQAASIVMPAPDKRNTLLSMSKEFVVEVPKIPRTADQLLIMLCKDFADFHVDIALVNVDEVVQNQARKLRNLASVTDVDKKILQEKAAIEDELKELDRKKKEQERKSFAARGRWKKAQRAAMMSVKVASKVQHVERRNSVNREIILQKSSSTTTRKLDDTASAQNSSSSNTTAADMVAANKVATDKAAADKAAADKAAADKAAADKAAADKAAAASDCRADTPSPSGKNKNKINSVVPENPPPGAKLENDEHLVVVKGSKKKNCVIC